MKLHALVTATALSAAMLVAGPAVSQDLMIDDQAIPLEQVDNFKQACDALFAANAASLTTDESQVEEDLTETGSVTPDPSASATPADPAAQQNWDEVLATLTVEQCETGGFTVSP